MTMTNRALDPVLLAARQQSPSFAPGPVAAPPKFHELLRECENKPDEKPSALSELSWPYRPTVRARQPKPSKLSKPIQPAQPAQPSALVRAWVWLNKKYPLAQAKRMRVAETIPLGEKRFVTLLTIDGREFLIGASTSGVSLLSQWDVAAETPVAVKPRFGMRGSSE